MALENRNLAPGTRLVATYKKQRYLCTVEAGEGGEGLAFVLEDGKRFKSPSAAAVAVTKVAQNGWRFWNLEGEAPAATEQLEAEKPKAKVKGRKLLYKLPNQKGTPEDQTKFFCVACMKPFLVEAGETPEVCPQGHAQTTLEDAGREAEVAEVTA